MNLDDLIDKAKDGKITKIEKEYVLNKIKEEDEDLYDYLYIIGRSSFFEYENLFVEYLKYFKRPDIVKLSLQVLCNYWNKTDKYISYAIEYSELNEWDDIGEVRLVAIAILGYYLNSRNKKMINDIEIIKKLLMWFNDNNTDKITKVQCYKSLALAYGIKLKEIPIKFNLETDLDKNILQWAKKLQDKIK